MELFDYTTKHALANGLASGLLFAGVMTVTGSLVWAALAAVLLFFTCFAFYLRREMNV